MPLSSGDSRVRSRTLGLAALVAMLASVASAPSHAQVPDAGEGAPSKLPLGVIPPTPVLSAPTGGPAEKLNWLKQQIDAAIAQEGMGAAKIGVAVVDVESGRTIYAKNDGLLLNPASNVKLVTTAAALAMLGPEYRWRTIAYADAPVHNGELRGRLYLRGTGDPTLVVEDLWRLTSELYAQGLRKVSGDLAVDDTFFDGERVGPGFEQKNEDAAYRAPNGALSLNYNAVGVHVLPGPADGAPARVVIDPQTPYFTIINEARTIAAGRTVLTVETREDGDHTLVAVRGRIRLKDPGQLIQRRVAHPDLYTAWAFRELLARRGIKVTGEIVRAPVPSTARALAAHASQPLGVAVRDVNKRSNNFMAEQILKTLGAETGGRPGTWQKGIDAVSGYLEKVGIARGEYKMTNGSGLYDSNRFTPAQLAALLRTAAKDFRYAADFVGSLALAGADGTIGHRMEGSLAERFVRAKTGTLAGISCLAGYAGAPGKTPLAFAVLMNGLPEPGTLAARKAQDAIAEALVAYLLAR